MLCRHLSPLRKKEQFVLTDKRELVCSLSRDIQVISTYKKLKHMLFHLRNHTLLPLLNFFFSVKLCTEQISDISVPTSFCVWIFGVTFLKRLSGPGSRSCLPLDQGLVVMERSPETGSDGQRSQWSRFTVKSDPCVALIVISPKHFRERARGGTFRWLRQKHMKAMDSTAVTCTDLENEKYNRVWSGSL